jgi:apolipoprotein D and lipocalin family protein
MRHHIQMSPVEKSFMRVVMRFILVLFGLSLAACATPMGGTPPGAPEPLKPVDASVFFTGRWYEIARTPNMFTNGCVAGTTDFLHNADGQLIERDACRKGTPEGPEKVFKGAVDHVNAENNKFVVHYTIFGFVPFAQTYWVLDHADDYSWFIVSNPSFQNIALLGRIPRQPPAVVADLTARAQAMGYDTSKLEFPEDFPPGEK